MKVFQLTLSPEYVKDWSVVDGIREFIQNSIDQEVLDKKNVSSIKASLGCMIIENNESILKHSTLLLGGGDKSDNNNLIGGFGEGYKVALLVLLREGFKIHIANYGLGELWEPEISYSHEYQTDLLKIVCKPLRHGVNVHRGVSVIITKTGFLFKDILSKISLRHNDHTVIAKHSSYGEILDPESIGKGKIFIGGLYISTSKELEYSYNFNPGILKIGRDRNITDTFDIKYYAGNYIFKYISSMYIDTFMKHLTNKAPDLEYINKYSLPDKAKQIITEQYKNIPVISCESDKDILRDHNISTKSAVIVPNVIKDFIWNNNLSHTSGQPIKRKSIKDLLVEFLERHQGTLTIEQYTELLNITKRN